MTICGKVCELLHKLALLAATPVIFYSLARICLGCVGKSYGLLVNFRARFQTCYSLAKVAILVDFL